jgi:hypothetical protein
MLARFTCTACCNWSAAGCMKLLRHCRELPQQDPGTPDPWQTQAAPCSPMAASGGAGGRGPALSQEPDHPEAEFLGGTASSALGAPAMAADPLQRAVARDPGDAAAFLNLGNACVDLDQLHDRENGMFGSVATSSICQGQWDGGDPVGRTILLHAEHGFCDTIQPARDVPLIAGRGGHPILAGERPLTRCCADGRHRPS